MNELDVHPHIESLRRYARVLTRAGQDADDLVQGALLRAYERCRTFRKGADLRVWLMAILHNHFIDQMRASKSSAALEQDWAESNPGFVLPEGEHVVRLRQVLRTFLSLPSEQREALHLIAIEGLSVADAATVLGTPAGTVMSRVGRARATLRQLENGQAAKHPSSALRLVRGSDAN
jgi:RNA polymerase sigma-70 factor (ECF subfamily)